MSKINIDTNELIAQLNTISQSIKEISIAGRYIQKDAYNNKNYNLKSLVRYKDLVKSIGASVETYVLCTERDINTMMKQVGVVEEVDRNIATKNKIDFKP